MELFVMPMIWTTASDMCIIVPIINQSERYAVIILLGCSGHRSQYFYVEISQFAK